MSEKSFAELVEAQRVFGDLGFTLDGTGYSKWYAINSGGYYRLCPVFDQGLSSSQEYKLVGFRTDAQELIPIGANEQIPWDKFPSECASDLSSIIANLAPDVFMRKRKANYIITAQCSKCDKHVESFLHVRGSTTCIGCAGIET